ncbi:hypothetical protein VCV18_006889 [Metarhizium anisopliae]
MTNSHVVLNNKRPEGNIIPGETFRKETGLAPSSKDLKNGEVLVEETRLYLPSVETGDALRSVSAARVIATRSNRSQRDTRALVHVRIDGDDGVGGNDTSRRAEILDMCLGQAEPGARFVECGMITQYKREDKHLNLTNYYKVISRVKILGFVVTDHTELWS